MNENISNILKYLLVIAVIAFIAWLFPKNTQTNYKYEAGSHWRYDELIAPFDFAIRKSDEELAKERKTILSDIYPFYLIDSEVGLNQKKSFNRSLNEEIRRLNLAEVDNDLVQRERDYRQAGLKLLNKLYSQGILLQDSISRNQKYINIVNGSAPELRPVNALFTVEKADNMLVDSLSQSGLLEAETLLDILHNCLVPNISFDKDLTQKYTDEALSRINPNKGVVLEGTTIISRADLITKSHEEQIRSFVTHYAEKVGTGGRKWFVFAGYLLLTSLIIGVYLLYLQFHAEEVFKSFRSLSFMLVWPVVFSFLLKVIEQTDVLSAYMIPFCIVPIVVKNIYSDKLALFAHIVIILIASFLSKEGYEFTFLQILAGIVTVLAVKETRYWGGFFYSIFFIFLTYVIGYLGLEMITKGQINLLEWKPLSWFIINAILTLLAYPLIPLLEKIFGFTSTISLAELSDLNRPLLKELSMKAPGTLQHSLQVANLCEAAADKIGAKSLLIKTAALYHDIGKTKEPQFFIENQKGANPHDELDDLSSAKKIIEHVTEGIKMAKKNKLPAVLIDFISTHHGTTRTEYFYRNYIKANPDITVDPKLFQYPGPKPQTREQAIMMLADSIEAASKSLKEHTGASLDGLVDGIVKSKLEQEQLIECNLSFKDLEAVKQVIKDTLRNIYHVRVEYPNMPEKAKKQEENQTNTAEKTDS
jgi:putative nucleotidyltransferase with HDIG domain